MSRPDDIAGSSLRLEQTPAINDATPTSKAVVRVFGSQKTLRCSNGMWTVNSVLANPVTRMAATPSGVFVGSRQLAVDIASAVVQDMLNEGDITPDPLHIRVASRAAVKEVFERAVFPVKGETRPYEDHRYEISKWREAPSELALVDIMGGLRSRVVTSDVGTLRGSGSSSIWRTRDTTHILTAMQHITHNDLNLYQGTDGHLAKTAPTYLLPTQRHARHQPHRAALPNPFEVVSFQQLSQPRHLPVTGLRPD